ncbi:DUF742 domain-containing protein [Plantactinospora sp. KBS50]|uniref:DUF742 domain-containing protein n=1 Tax=Plantactinospora sp. KBS50 TaxID=2024580 RepID=UPI000BAA9FF6|nr:DUF742 domain-containing protein [Plantactinospora sp. KBS50]ASW56964.1 hypothetical protein CIK06_26620 [Plantactinospora sp. KBS50]
MTWPGGDDPDPEHRARIRPFLSSPFPLGSGDDGRTEADAPTGAPRPFVLTAGRVAGADPAIGLETQVTTRAGFGVGRTTLVELPPESQGIVRLCQEPLSVVEISARLRLQFGVTRVLVGDLRAAGYLDVHVEADPTTNPDLILRVIHGLRALS